MLRQSTRDTFSSAMIKKSSLYIEEHRYIYTTNKIASTPFNVDGGNNRCGSRGGRGRCPRRQHIDNGRHTNDGELHHRGDQRATRGHGSRGRGETPRAVGEATRVCTGTDETGPDRNAEGPAARSLACWERGFSEGRGTSRDGVPPTGVVRNIAEKQRGNIRRNAETQREGKNGRRIHTPEDASLAEDILALRKVIKKCCALM